MTAVVMPYGLLLYAFGGGGKAGCRCNLTILCHMLFQVPISPAPYSVGTLVGPVVAKVVTVELLQLLCT